MKKITLLSLATIILTGCASSSGPQSLQTNDSRECAKNFTYNGSFLAGRMYKSHAFIGNVSQGSALKRAARYTVNNGFTIISTDKELGIISASQTVSYGKGKTVPLNISLEPKNKGVNVAITYSTSGGVTSPLDAISSHFCGTMEAIAGK